MFRKILIANRGEIAVRVMRTAHRLGIACVAVYSDADAEAMHVALADEAYRIGPPPARDSYLHIEAVIGAAIKSKADAIHPGYGFLSENAAFADACAAAGIVFIGPPADAIRAMGLKDAAKRLMADAGVPVVPGYHGERQEADFLASEASRIGFPVLIKARAGGGGKGMRRVDDAASFRGALEAAQREALSSFGDGAVLIEKYVSSPRHIEVQVFADAHGSVVHLGERDCSLQRRHQKVIEEAPAPGMTLLLRDAMGEAAVKAAAAVGYRGAGTVEFIADASDGLRLDRFYFMEMNTRLQVEHPVTEAVTGLDLVELQLRVAAGEPLPFSQRDVVLNGHAVEARLYAEDAAKDFAPATGRLHRLRLPDAFARIDTGVREGDTVTPFYDPMLAKVIVHGKTRDEAFAQLSRALGETQVAGCVTNAGFLRALVDLPQVRAGDVDTGLIARSMDSLTGAAEPDAVVLGLAALASLGLLGDSGPAASPFAHFRVWGHAVYRVRLLRGDRELEVMATALGRTVYRIESQGVPPCELAVTPRVAGVARFAAGERIGVAHHAVFDGAVAIFVDGAAFTFTVPPVFTADEDQTGSGDRIAAPFPGTIKLAQAEAGRRVKKGDPLLVLEAMKMDHTLSAPRDGVVADVLVKPGQQVKDGAVLVTLEAAHG
jgi:3-methylcrotonyl-CoA carboxylase alpha subunit